MKLLKKGIEMELISVVIGILIIIIIGMLFGRLMQILGLIFEANVKLKKSILNLENMMGRNVK